MVSIIDFLNVYSLVICAIGLLWYYSQSTHNYWRKLNVKFLKPIPFFGNIASYVLQQKPLNETIDTLYKHFLDEPFGGFYEFRDPLLLVKDPELISDIMIKDFKNFTDRKLSLFFNPDKKINPLSVNISTARGDRWKALRHKMTPLFSTSKVRQMCDHVFYCVDLLIELIDKQMDCSGSVDVVPKQLFDRLTVDVIGTCGFGIECNALKSNKKFVKMCGEPFKPSLATVIRLILTAFNVRLQSLFNFRDFPKDVSDFFMNLSLDTVKYRRQNCTSRNDILQQLMSLQNSHTDSQFAVQNKDVTVLKNDEFDEIDIAANTFMFFIAGSETTSAALTFCLYELALNQGIQERLRSEIQQIQREYETINYESLKKMTFLNAVIDETLRKYPSITFIYRECTEEYMIPRTTVKIPAGVGILIPAWSIHHDWRNYPNPEEFDPERFLGDNKQSKTNGVYLPFGDGPRICLGKYFAEVEMKAALSAIILKYDVKPCAKTDIPLKFEEGTPFLAAKPEIRLNISRRTD